MEHKNVERRRGRRVDLEAPLVIRRLGVRESRSLTEQVTKNIGLGGVYFETDQAGGYGVNEMLMTSISILESQRREFPFTRLAGPTRVVRVNELSSSQTQGTKRFGIAIEFGNDLTILTATPLRS